MCIQIVQDQHNFLSVRVKDTDKLAEHLCKILLRPMGAHRYMPPATQRLKAHEQATHPLPLILVVKAFQPARLKRDEHARFADQLFAGFIEAYLWVAGIIRARVDV